ncbi:hypothetical protein ACHWQZ_G019163 [Mnemiopsis leidyi]
MIKFLLVLGAVIAVCLSYPKYRAEDSTEEVDPDEGGTCSGDKCVPARGSPLFLKTGQQIESSKIRAVMQSDGNFVIYCKHWCPCRRRAIWATNTHNKNIDTGLKIESDGNLALYETNGKKAWQSGKREKGGKFELVAQEDSNLVLYVENNGKKTSLWASNTDGKC